MRPTAPRWWRAVALLASVVVVVASFAAPAAADPEDGNPTLQQKLEEAQREVQGEDDGIPSVR